MLAVDLETLFKWLMFSTSLVIAVDCTVISTYHELTGGLRLKKDEALKANDGEVEEKNEKSILC